MIPKTIEDVLNPKFRISEYADYTEINAWMTWMNYAVQEASTNLANAKYDLEIAEFEYNKEYEMQYNISSEDDNVTTKKSKAKINEKVLEKQRAIIDLKYKVALALALVEGVKERAGCIRKIATLRANMLQYGGTDSNQNDKSKVGNSDVPFSFMS